MRTHLFYPKKEADDEARHGMMVQMLVFCLGGIVLAVAAVAFGFGTIAPFLLFGGCLLMMMIMMMRGMGGMGGRRGQDDEHHDPADKPS